MQSLYNQLQPVDRLRPGPNQLSLYFHGLLQLQEVLSFDSGYVNKAMNRAILHLSILQPIHDGVVIFPIRSFDKVLSRNRNG